METPVRGLSFVLACALALGGRLVEGQVNPNGRIQSQGWLALGSFTNPFGCTLIHEYFLTLHLAPSSIHVMTPDEGDSIDYDPALASTSRYSGPRSNGKPIWRRFDDRTEDEDLNFEVDATLAGGEVEAVVTYVATYFEYLGASPIDVELCVGNEDGAQVWIDKDLVFNWNGCRDPRGECDHLIPATIQPGLHRIALGIWEHGGGWGGSLGFKVGGGYITDEDPDWVFLGTERSGLRLPGDGVFVREIEQPNHPNACPPEVGGPLDVTIRADLVPGGPIALVKDVVPGSFGPEGVTVRDGGVASLIAQTPVRPFGMFADVRTVGTDPVCPGGNGQVTHDDAGTPGNPGDDRYQVENVGSDIWALGDTFTFAYNKVEGNFVLTAHIRERSEAPARWGKHGVMARQDLTPRSRYSFLHDQQDPVSHGEDDLDQTRWASRPSHGGSDNYESSVLGPAEHHDWVRIERAGSIFRGYSSPDGAEGTWVLHGVQDWGASAPAAVLAGLAVTSRAVDCGFPLRISFDEVDLTLGQGAFLVPYAAPEPIGVDVRWTNVPREALRNGLRYTVDVHSGTQALNGMADGDIILGEGFADLGKAVEDHGPFSNPALQHGHNIGIACPTSVTQPIPGVLEVTGAGNDVWIDGDFCTFAYTEATGDFSARVTVTDRVFAPGSRWGRYGIMARQDCSLRSRYSFIQDQGENLADSVRFTARPTHGGQDNFSIVPPLGGLHSNTFRLDRCGDTFIGYIIDEDGSLGAVPGSWVELGRNEWVEDPPETVHLGLAVTSSMGCEPTTITFEDWTLAPGCSSGVEDLVCTRVDDDLRLAWRNPSGADGSPPISIRVEGVELFTVAGTATGAAIPIAGLPDDRIATIAVVNSGGIPATCTFPVELSSQGFIKTWLLLGPFLQPGGCGPGEEAIRLDYITDGKGIEETTVQPREGDTVETDFEGTAASIGLASTPVRPDLNPGGVPTWASHASRDDTVRFDEHYGALSINNVVMVAVIYVEVEEEKEVEIGLGSDDAVQVLLDGIEVHINNVCRGDGGPNMVQDIIRDVTLAPGIHTLLVKVFDGLFGHSFRLRFQDANGFAVHEGIRTSLEPPHGTKSFHRGDATGDGRTDISDAIFALNFLFLGGPEPGCLEAVNSNDDAALDITDAVALLNFLFLGGPEPLPPGPEPAPCGPDPANSPTDLGCAAYGGCSA